MRGQIRTWLPFLGIFFFSIGGMLTASPLFADDLEPLSVSVNIPGGEFQYGQEIHLTASDPNAKIFWTLYPTASPAAGHVETGEATFHVRRTATLHYFAFRGYDDETKIYEQRFFIESPEENEYLKIIEVDPNPDRTKRVQTVEIQNLSNYPSDLSEWKLVSDYDEVFLPVQELDSKATLRFIVSLKDSFGKIELISPNGDVKDVVFYNDIPEDSVIKRTVNLKKKSVSEYFFIEPHS